MTKTRIYCVSNTADRQLVRASSGAQAIRFVIKDAYSAIPATQDQLVELLSSGEKVQDATKSEE